MRPLDMSRFEDELKIIWDIYNSAWDMNWGSVPMTRKEFAYSAREMKSFVHPMAIYLVSVREFSSSLSTCVVHFISKKSNQFFEMSNVFFEAY